jgi:GT2 family glycosyltransferase
VDSIIALLNDRINMKIIIVDNQSTKHEKKLLKEYYINNSLKDKVLEIIFIENNIGYFPAIEYSYQARRAYIDQCDYVIIGNNDLIFDNSFMTRLSQKKYNEDIYVVCPDIINKDNNHQNPQVRYRYSILQLTFLHLYHSSYFMASAITLISKFIKFRGSQKSKDNYMVSQYISIGYGACYILTQKYINYIGFIPSYLFLMNEENALSDTVFKNGGRIYYDTDLIVCHMEHTSVNLAPKIKMFKIAQKSYRISQKHFNNKYLYDKKIEENEK